jgi:ABC-type glycerol-3-phosphate transport system substrate-binding protein
VEYRVRRIVGIALAAGLFGLSLTSCGLSGRRVLVWHDWPEPQAEVLIELLHAYSELDPNLRLIIEYVPSGELEARFIEEARSGFGPDVMLGVDADRLADLAAADAVRPISPAQSVDHGFDQLEARAVQVMAIDGSQLGVPLAGFTDVLYYRHGIEPPATLRAVIDLAEAGHTMGIPVDFVGAYWGIDAFGGTVFGGDNTLAPDNGFVEWMEWMLEAGPQPNVILGGDYDSLLGSFARGRIDLFVGSSGELAQLRSVLSDPADEGGEPRFGLTTLPGATNETPGGFLEIEGMVINRHTDHMIEALALLEYLTNVPSQGRIARSGLGRIPINDSVAIDPTISPVEAALLRQQRRSVVLPRSFEENLADLTDLGNEIYLQVARGLLPPADAGGVLRARYDELTRVDHD